MSYVVLGLAIASVTAMLTVITMLSPMPLPQQYFAVGSGAGGSGSRRFLQPYQDDITYHKHNTYNNDTYHKHLAQEPADAVLLSLHNISYTSSYSSLDYRRYPRPLCAEDLRGTQGHVAVGTPSGGAFNKYASVGVTRGHVAEERHSVRNTRGHVAEDSYTYVDQFKGLEPLPVGETALAP